MLVKANTMVFRKLFEIRSELSNISKDKDGYGFRYLSLEKLLEKITPSFQKKGLFLTQTSTLEENDNIVVETLIVDVVGAEKDNYVLYRTKVPILKDGKMNDVQKYGASTTYARRYQLMEILGIAAEEDADQPEAQTDERIKEIEERKKAVESLGLTVDENGKIAGKTFEFKNQLKQLGCRWDSRAKAWVVA